MSDSDREKYESVHRVSSDAVEVTSWTRYSGGTDDSKIRRSSIEKVADRSGVEHELVWDGEETEIFPGATTVRKDGIHVLRISRDALPVRVLFRKDYEYRSCDDWEYDSASTSYHWVRHGFAEGSDPTVPFGPEPPRDPQ